MQQPSLVEQVSRATRAGLPLFVREREGPLGYVEVALHPLSISKKCPRA